VKSIARVAVESFTQRSRRSERGHEGNIRVVRTGRFPSLFHFIS